MLAPDDQIVRTTALERKNFEWWLVIADNKIAQAVYRAVSREGVIADMHVNAADDQVRTSQAVNRVFIEREKLQQPFEGGNPGLQRINLTDEVFNRGIASPSPAGRGLCQGGRCKDCQEKDYREGAQYRACHWMPPLVAIKQ